MEPEKVEMTENQRTASPSRPGRRELLEDMNPGNSTFKRRALKGMGLKPEDVLKS